MKSGKPLFIVGIIALGAYAPSVAQAGWMDFVDSILQSPTAKEETNAPPATAPLPLGQEEIVAGLKEALQTGFKQAVLNLGREGGFLNDDQVKITMPATLSPIKMALDMAKQGAVADQFVATMNRAAEKAIPVTASVFAQAIQAMSLTDATKLLQGPEDAATAYFRQNSEEQLIRSIRPIVADATQQVGLTAAYKLLTSTLSQQSGLFNSLMTTVNSDGLDLDGYVTSKAIDGLFIKLAEEEKRIRQNPAARGSELLEKVFGSIAL